MAATDGDLTQAGERIVRFIGTRMTSYGPVYFDSVQLRSLGIGDVGTSVSIHTTCILVGLENMRIGSNVRIDPFCTLIAAEGSIEIGSYVHIGGYSFLSGGEGIRIEDFAGLSQGVRVYSRSDDYSGETLTNPMVPERYRKVTKGPVRLDRHVIVGSGSVILPGVTVGEGTAIGAMSLVRKSLDPWGVYFGVPARRLRDRSKDLLEMERLFRQDDP